MGINLGNGMRIQMMENPSKFIFIVNREYGSDLKCGMMIRRNGKNQDYTNYNWLQYHLNFNVAHGGQQHSLAWR